MSKINLLTMHYYKNNGAFLQTYATLQILRSLGHDVTLLDFRKKIRHDLRWWVEFNSQLHYEHLRKRFYGKKTPVFDIFDSRLLPESDYTISGSDQIWNPAITGIDYLHYFLDFVPESVKRVSLASSFGKKAWTDSDEMAANIRNELKKFHAVSVRESSGVDICREWGIDAVQVPDPTIVWQDYEPISGKIQEQQKIICFIFRFTDLFFKTARILQKQTGLPVQVINMNRFTRQSLEDMKGFEYGHFNGCTAPDYWLQKICGAAFVITDSFHANVFSMKTHRRFITLCADPVKFERIRFLLKTFGLEQHIVLSEDELTSDLAKKAEEYNMDYLNSQMKVQQELYYSFIQKNIR